MIERTWVSRRTRQQVGQQQSALGLKARFNPCRDSAACTIVMRLQRRLKRYFSDDQTLYSVSQPKHSLCSVHVLCEHLPPTDESACKPKSLCHVEKNPFNVARNVLANYRVYAITIQAVLAALGLAVNHGSLILCSQTDARAHHCEERSSLQ